jgi:hypothetical protein
MITEPRRLQHAVEGATLADVLERVLDKGVVIAGDIKIKLVDIELLTIQIRLVVASVDKAIEMGMNWWTFNPELTGGTREAERQQEIAGLRERIETLEAGPAREPIRPTGRARG